MTNGFSFSLRGDWDRASHLEWLETNGIGGYASSTACGANTRRYHGLLVAATEPPVGRVVLLSKLDERIIAGGSVFELASNQFPGVIHPDGFKLLESFSRDVFPVFEYSASGFRLRKTIAAIDGENTTLIIYALEEASMDVTLELRPFIAARDYHSLASANDGIRRDAAFQDGIMQLQPYDGSPMLYLSTPGATFHPAPDWYRRFEYPIEQERGLEFHEDLFTPGTFTVSLKSGMEVGIIASTSNPAGRDAGDLLARERHRREGLVANAGNGRATRALFLAADQFIVRRGVSGKTILAGYPWFNDWGRDTMIALPGLCLSTGRFQEARRILLAFAESASEGMLPNCFPDAGRQPEYNSVDAALWFFVATKKYLDATADRRFVSESLLEVLRDIVSWHMRGTRYGIHVDRDGLLSVGTSDEQLTWMDARVWNRSVTPRCGKPVEIQALWFNALQILAELERKLGSPESADALTQQANRTRARFNELFWNEERQCLHDVVHDEGVDPSLRPNQIFAVSLPWPMVDRDRGAGVLAAVERYLETGTGLRTLEPGDPRFIGVYEGPPERRDAAYHQGTVWPWLLGPYVDALIRIRGDEGMVAAGKIIAGMEMELASVCVGSLSEIYDGADPRRARGCFAQAWSVGELLRLKSRIRVESS